MSKLAWHVRKSGRSVVLHAPCYRLHLNVDGEPAASSWENLLTGRRLDLAGSELEVDVDSAVKRLWIEGWRAAPTQDGPGKPNAETGYRQGYCRPEYDDSQWKTGATPATIAWGQAFHWCWARTHVYLPEDCRGRPLRLVLGGFGVFDYRYTRVFINGRPLGVRRARGQWFQPGQFDLGPGTAIHRCLRFGQDNVIAVQLADLIKRTRKLDEFDARGAFCLPWPSTHLGQYEQHVAVGVPTKTLTFRVSAVRSVRQQGRPAVEVTLRARQGNLGAMVVYRPDADGRILHRSVTLTNTGRQPVRIMGVRLGEYRANSAVSEGYMGLPVYLDGQFFVSLDHPAGWATGQEDRFSLRQYPGALIGPGESFRCMNSVWGVAEGGAAREQFVRHIRTRMRRVVRHHDKPLAIFETFGGWSFGPKNASFFGDFLSEALTQDICLHYVKQLRAFRRQTGRQFDVFSLEFWCDPRGDMVRFKSAGFPKGFGPVKRALQQEGIAPGLWIATSSGVWNIGRNPAIVRCRAENPSYPAGPIETSSICLAAEPFRSILTNGLRHHLRYNAVRLVKLDGTHCLCYNTCHEHLPGIYSTEAIYNAMIRMLQALDRECPDVFIILYWGCHSPWWLLYGDTLFEPGIHVEAASPSPWPSLYARDGVTVGLDQAQVYAQDIPPLGKDSLGVWLSDWPWNSCIGKQRWQEGMVMDMCRGSLLMQPWTDAHWLTPPERRQFARFLDLLRQRPECFGNPRFILASPWEHKPYGYCCGDGDRAFIAVTNPTWEDVRVSLQLGPEWGLARGAGYELYRHYPQPARLRFRDDPILLLRPYETVLLEAVPRGQAPTGGVRMPSAAPVREFREGSREIPLHVSRPKGNRGPAVEAEKRPVHDIFGPIAGRLVKTVRCLRGEIPACSTAAVAVVSAEITRQGRALPVPSVAGHFGAQAWLRGRGVEIQPVLPGRTYPAAWQAWRLPVEPSLRPRPFELCVASVLPEDAELSFGGHFVPQGRRC